MPPHLLVRPSNIYYKIQLNKVAEELTKHVRTSKLVVNKENQKNDWIISSIKGELESKGFSINHSYSHTNFSVFGKSLPDLKKASTYR